MSFYRRQNTQNEIELDDMAATTKADKLMDNDEIAQLDEEMFHATHPAVEVWAYGTAGWLALLSLPHLLFPRMLMLMSSPEEGAEDHQKHPLQLTQLEKFFSMHFGILLVALALCLVLAIPSASPVAPRPQEGPIQHPLLTPLSLAMAVMAFSSYNSAIHGLGAFPMIIAVGCGAVSLWGFWVMFFASEGKKSKKTGANKRTSTFLFGNKQAASHQKKEWKKGQKSE